MLPPVGHGQQVPGLRGSLDFLGLNYYCEEKVRFNRAMSGSMCADLVPPPVEQSRTASGWAIDAPGLRRAIVDLHNEFGIPIMVTENGVADDNDELRAAYIRDHLSAVAGAVADGAEVLGYLYWTAYDNFEWLDGYSQRFGLIAVDRDTLERRVKPSAQVYAEICRTRTIIE